MTRYLNTDGSINRERIRDLRLGLIPGPWEEWEIWQYTNKGTIPGIEGDVDLDWFRL